MPDRSDRFNSIICPVCGNLNPAEARVCRECLTPLGSRRATTGRGAGRFRRSNSSRADEIRRFANSFDAEPPSPAAPRKKSSVFGLDFGHIDMKTIAPMLAFLALFSMNRGKVGKEENWFTRLFR